MYDLSAFQRDTLLVISGMGGSSGVEIREELDGYYENPITGGRLYPCLDALVDYGLVEKGKKDDRTNEYTLSKQGQRKLAVRREWEDGLAEI